MRYLDHIICILLALFLAIPASAADNGGGKLNTSQIVVGHIKDSYDWHVTDIGKKHIVINLPVIVKSSTGWHVFSTAKFAEEADAKGYRKGPFNLAIASQGEHAGKIVELQGYQYHEDSSRAFHRLYHPLALHPPAGKMVPQAQSQRSRSGWVHRTDGDVGIMGRRQHREAWSGRGL